MLYINVVYWRTQLEDIITFNIRFKETMQTLEINQQD